MTISLTIDGYPICGAVGGKITIPVWDCWDSYRRYFERQIAEDRPVTVLGTRIVGNTVIGAVWRVKGKPIKPPTAFFLTLQDVPMEPGMVLMEEHYPYEMVLALGK